MPLKVNYQDKESVLAGGHRRTDLPGGIVRSATRLVWVSDSGHRVGEDHPKAVLTDGEVDQIRDLHEAERWGYQRLAEAFSSDKGTIAKICQYKRRITTKSRCKRVYISAESQD